MQLGARKKIRIPQMYNLFDLPVKSIHDIQQICWGTCKETCFGLLQHTCACEQANVIQRKKKKKQI